MAQISPKINKFLELSIDEKEAVAEDGSRKVEEQSSGSH